MLVMPAATPAEFMLPLSEYKLPRWVSFCPDGVSFCPEHYLQPCSLLSSHQIGYVHTQKYVHAQKHMGCTWDMYIHKTPPSPPKDTPFPCLNLKVSKMNHSLGNLDPNVWKVGKTFLEVGKKSLFILQLVSQYQARLCVLEQTCISYTWWLAVIENPNVNSTSVTQCYFHFASPEPLLAFFKLRWGNNSI